MTAPKTPAGWAPAVRAAYEAGYDRSGAPRLRRTVRAARRDGCEDGELESAAGLPAGTVTDAAPRSRAGPVLAFGPPVCALAAGALAVALGWTAGALIIIVAGVWWLACAGVAALILRGERRSRAAQARRLERRAEQRARRAEAAEEERQAWMAGLAVGGAGPPPSALRRRSKAALGFAAAAVFVAGLIAGGLAADLRLSDRQISDLHETCRRMAGAAGQPHRAAPGPRNLSAG